MPKMLDEMHFFDAGEGDVCVYVWVCACVRV